MKNCNFCSANIFSVENICPHCVKAKARVKEAIESHMFGNCIGSKCDCLKEILKELGL